MGKAGKNDSTIKNEPRPGSVVDEENETTGQYYGTEAMRRAQEDFFDNNIVTGGGVSRHRRRGNPTPDYTGYGPKGYERSDERIQEIVCEALSEDPYVDAREISVTCEKGVVTLEGTVSWRRMKHRAEDLVDAVRGVREIHNHIRITSRQDPE